MTNHSFEATRIAAANARKKAKDVRKKWLHLGSLAQRDIEFGLALQGLDEAIHDLTPFVADNSAYRSDAEREIGDCHGVKGGLYRLGQSERPPTRTIRVCPTSGASLN